MKKLLAAELVFIPAPAIGHLISTVEMAKLLIGRDQRLSITLLIITFPSDTTVTTYARSLLHLNPNNNTPDRLRFLVLPPVDSNPIHSSLPPITSLSTFIENHATHVKDAVTEIVTRSADTDRRLAGFVVDVFCTPMIDVASEFGVPTYTFFTSGAAFLGFNLYLLNLSDNNSNNQDVTEFIDSVTELSVPSFVNSVPTKLVPSLATDKEGGSAMVLSLNRRLKQTKGIMVNTFYELESYALNSLQVDGNNPTIYPVGPVLNINRNGNGNDNVIMMMMSWLDQQPPSSVLKLELTIAQ